MKKVYQKNLVTFFIRQWKIKDVKGHQVSLVNENSDPIDINLNKYVDHPSMFKIKEYFNKYTESNFLEITPNNIKKQIKNLDSPKKDSKISQ